MHKLKSQQNNGLKYQKNQQMRQFYPRLDMANRTYEKTSEKLAFIIQEDQDKIFL